MARRRSPPEAIPGRFPAFSWRPVRISCKRVSASNAAGKSIVISEEFTVLTPLSVTISGPGSTSIADGTYLEAGTTYTIRAIPKPGQLFYYWSSGSFTSISPAIPFTMTDGLALKAIFISNALPKSVSFTYPVNKTQLKTNSFTITGKISPAFTNVQVSVQLFQNTEPATGELPATVSGTTWSIPSGTLQLGAYTAVAIAYDPAGNQTLISEEFIVNVYPTIAGTYYGVFIGPDIATNTAGLIKMNLADNGIMTGRVSFPSVSYTVAYALGASGGVELAPNPNPNGFYFDISFDLSSGSDTASGFVDWQGYQADFIAYRAATELPANTLAGKYVLDLQTMLDESGSGPTNDGYATLTIGNTGGLTLGGTLADNTPFSETVGVSKDGIWPVYASLYGGHGMLIGWETNVIGANGAAGSTGTLYWIKGATRNTYFSNGFNVQAASTGTNYIAPVPGTGYQVVFSGGSITTPLNNSLTVSGSRQFVPAPGAPDKLTISLSAAGVIAGSIFNPADNKTLPIRGAFSSPAAGGSGFVLDPDGQTEPFQITLVP